MMMIFGLTNQIEADVTAKRENILKSEKLLSIDFDYNFQALKLLSSDLLALNVEECF